MATIGISEFAFGYAFLYEQTRNNWGSLKAAPVLPSLQKEKDEGWDAHLPLIGVDFFYQFKLSDHLSRGNASYIADGTYNGPYYRISLHRRHNNLQHRRLRQLAATQPNVYYVAPEFDTLDDFNSAFLAGQIAQRSRLIPLRDCRDFNDDVQHHITFQINQPSWNEHSERVFHEKSFTGRELQRLYERSRESWRPIDRRFAATLFERVATAAESEFRSEARHLSTAARALLSDGGANSGRNDLLLRAAQIASVVFGATLLLVGSRE
jgi:hypothetical protein